MKVKWPSQTRSKELQNDLEPLGKALVRGTFKQIASTAFKCRPVRIELVKLVLKETVNEMIGLCRGASTEALTKLTLEDVCTE